MLKFNNHSDNYNYGLNQRRRIEAYVDFKFYESEIKIMVKRYCESTPLKELKKRHWRQVKKLYVNTLSDYDIPDGMIHYISLLWVHQCTQRKEDLHFIQVHEIWDKLKPTVQRRIIYAYLLERETK